MCVSEELKGLISKVKKRAGRVDEIGKIVEKVRNAVRRDLVECRKLACKGEGCMYKHSSTSSNQERSSQRVVSRSVFEVSNHIVIPPERDHPYFEASEPLLPPKNLLRQSFLTDLEGGSDSEDEVLKSYIDLTTSTLYRD